MTMIGGPGGISGPKAPEGPSGAPEIDEVTGDAPVEQAHDTARPGDVEALAADVAAGRLTRQEAIDRLVEATAGPGLGATERAELRAVLADLVTADPYLGDLVGRI